MITLSKRLATIAGLIPKTGGVADVGTDHGCIPVWLCQNGHTGRLIATDIRKGPLDSARRTASENGVADMIEFCLCDGLSGVDGQDIDTVVIAGMGGETIASILGAALWTKNGAVLLLQPMSKADFLRRWLVENGFLIKAEGLVRDGILYEIITACGGEDTPLSEAEALTGRFGIVSGLALFPERLDELINRSRRTIAGLRSAKRPDAARLEKETGILEELQNMKSKLR